MKNLKKQERVEFQVPIEVYEIINKLSNGNRDERLNKSKVSRTIFIFGLSFFGQQNCYFGVNKETLQKTIIDLDKWLEGWACQRNIVELRNSLKLEEKV